jgi:MurE/MurF fusion protein
MIERIDCTSDLIQRLKRQCPDARLCLDSRRVRVGDVFVAVAGHSGDGRHFMADAVARGASALVCQAPLPPEDMNFAADVPVFEVQQLRSKLGELAAAWYAEPSAGLTIIAITGTNGKTTTAQWLASALNHFVCPCGVIGTLGVTLPNGSLLAGDLTTPDVLEVHRLLAELRQSGATHVVMEASSIGLEQGRLDGVLIDTAVFTNLTPDHLDYHLDMAAYAHAKSLLFSRPEIKHAVVNADDPYVNTMIQVSTAEVLRFGLSGLDQSEAMASVVAQNVNQGPSGQSFDLVVGAARQPISTPFVGLHNLSNMLAVAATLHALRFSAEDIAQVLSQLPPVQGRLERVQPIRQGQRSPAVFVDYAHTTDALSHVLKALRPLVQTQTARLWVVVGCGGDRDRLKRAEMARACEQYADCVVLTSDNPRSESPLQILEQMRTGLQNPDSVRFEPDRALAILSCIWQANSHDVVLIAGKGHETWQEIAGKRHPFDDRQWARLAALMYEEPPSVETDTRKLTRGALFVALKGEQFDGHDYLAAAQQAGAQATIVQSSVDSVALPQIALGDTRVALRILASAWRARFNVPVIGITGSNGKTTTKEMTAAICRAWVGEHKTLWTQGNLNNEIGVPLTVLRLRASHAVAVIEMGMNHPGEIELLAKIAQPTVGLVLNAQREHQEFMHSVQAVAQENAAVLQVLPKEGVAVYPDDDTYTSMWTEAAAHVSRHCRFGRRASADLTVSQVHVQPHGSAFDVRYAGQEATVSMSMPGEHNVVNASAAIACAISAGASLSDAVNALARFSAVKGRLQMHRLNRGLIVIDDTYNANPDSVRAAIDVLATMPKPCALVLGDMGEVGDQGDAMHVEVGRYAKEKRIDYLWAIGSATKQTVEAFGERGRWFGSPQALYKYAQSSSIESVLVKGSRFMAMEKIVAQWVADYTAEPTKETAHHAR